MTHPDLDVAPRSRRRWRRACGGGAEIHHHRPRHALSRSNIETAREVERIIRAEGALPATIAVLDGRLKVGLDDAALQRVAQSPDMAKASVRDLPVLVASRRDGATTVASTMRIAAMAGIRVFATGGIGGGTATATPFDMSADLTELAARRCWWSAPGRRASSTCRGRWRCSRRSACR